MPLDSVNRVLSTSVEQDISAIVGGENEIEEQTEEGRQKSRLSNEIQGLDESLNKIEKSPEIKRSVASTPLTQKASAYGLHNFDKNPSFKDYTM